MSSVAIVDIGSNSIKILVAERKPNGQVAALFQNTLEVRISAGISAAQPVLQKHSMTAGLNAIQALLSSASPYSPQQIILVATSAVREAANGAEFCKLVHDNTGNPIRLLSGEVEANAIGRGLLCDPTLTNLQNFTLVDLGGGSLECLIFQNRRIIQATSMPLGCVRLAEKFVPNRPDPLDDKTVSAIIAHVGNTLREAGFSRSAENIRCIAMGGSVVCTRSIFAAKSGITLEETSPYVSRRDLGNLLDTLAGMTLSERQKMPGLPIVRADVFPTAIATLIGVADFFSTPKFYHSFYNLRFGIADELLK